ncbi:serine hydrolase domain-containing protein [Streptodolium elevatio]|uniref:Serine hydrolase domain-containing protein n=1 Tax=Streptodolium elevatio TaxID=3157996 RepID=A0ABV3DQR4_9ACTN
MDPPLPHLINQRAKQLAPRIPANYVPHDHRRTRTDGKHMPVSRRSFVTGMLAFSGAIAGCSSEGKRAGGSAGSTPSPSGNPQLPAEWDAYHRELERLAAEGSFSGAVLVARGGKPILTRGYGMADRERGVLNDAATKFCIASLGKPLTAVAIARLAETRKLAFDDPVGKHVPGLPAALSDKVTIHHLLTHTSGMGDVLEAGGADAPQTIAGLMSVIAAQPLGFEPGTRFRYSNSGFLTLGAVIEHVSGEPYADHMRRRVFDPAGMPDTEVRPYKPSEIPNMAHGYALIGPDGKLLPPGSAENVRPSDATLRDISGDVQFANPSGGAYSTVTDLFNFARGVSEHLLLGPETTKTLLAGRDFPDRGQGGQGGPGSPAAGRGAGGNGPGANGPAGGGAPDGNGPAGAGGSGGNGPAPSGPPPRYAYGFTDETHNGARIVGHNGGTPGYGGQLDVYLGRGDTVVILSNQDGTGHASAAATNSRAILAP